MTDEHGGSKKHQSLAMVNAPNVTSSSVKQDPHGRDRMVSLNNESREMDISDVESVVDPHRIVRATRLHNPYYKKLREQEDPKRINKRGKFCRKIASQDKVRESTCIKERCCQNEMLRFMSFAFSYPA